MKKAFLAMTIALTPFVSGLTQETYRPGSITSKDRQIFVIHADKTHERYMQMTTEITTTAGIEERGEIVLSYQSALETLDVTEATTVTKDGMLYPVAKDKIRTLDDELSSGAEYSDTKHKVIIFPQVEVGSRLTFSAYSKQHTPHFGDQFFTVERFPVSEIHQNTEYIIYVHPSVELIVSAKYMEGGKINPNGDLLHQFPPGSEGYDVYRYQYSNLVAYPSEPGQVRDIEHSAHLIVSTFRDYVQVGASYQRLASPKTRVTPRVKELALQITSGLSDSRDRAKAIYYWVLRNMRYVAVQLGDGGFEPNDVETILDSGYGDCKDHVVVLESLLRAVGIESTAALINAGSSYQLAPVASPHPFNHVISYLPGLDVYLDPTARFSEFGTLPESALDKPVVLTALKQISSTPKMKAAEHVTESRIHLAMNPDGSFSGKSKTVFRGTPEADARSMHMDRQSRSPARFVRQILARFNETGTGVIRDTDPANLDQAFELLSEFELDAIANVPGPSALTLPIGLTPGRIASKAFTKPHKNRRIPVVCASETLLEYYEIRFPESVRVIRTPVGLNYDQDGIKYRSTYQLTSTPQGQMIQAVRELSVQRERNVCRPEEQFHWEAFHSHLQRDIRSQIFFE
jgi:transglutaminase-like putative cysteine protease